MIEVRRSSGRLEVRPRDESGSEILARPLHRLFLRGFAGGTALPNENLWLIPFKDDAASALRALLEHFARYKIEVVLDSSAKTLLAEFDSRMAGYLTALRNGAAAKKELILSGPPALDEVLHSLGRPLKEFQTRAVHHLLAVGNGANFSVPGSGKTSVVLTYFEALKRQGTVEAILVIGPASCFAPWESEYEACFGRRPNSVRIAGHTRSERRDIMALSGRYELLLTTYHSAARDVADLAKELSRRRYLLVLDESHYVKRPQGGKLAETVLAIAARAQRRVILTGTPMPNGLSDLWSQITFLWPQQKPLGEPDDFLRETQSNSPEAAIRKIRERIAPLFFRISKSELGLPRPVFHVVKCKMSPLQDRIYRGIAIQFLSQLKEAPSDREALRQWRKARSVRLLQVAVNPDLLVRSCREWGLHAARKGIMNLTEAIYHYPDYETPRKIEVATEIVSQVANRGGKVIVWSSFIHNLHVVSRLLEAYSPVVIFGDVPVTTSDPDEMSREALIKRFREDDKCHLLVANPAACAESISLHDVCHDAVYLDRSFNCAHYLQSLDRIHRIGLDPGVRTTYHLLLSANSVDEVVHRRLQEKSRQMRDVIEGDLPGVVPGYWSEDLGEEEEVDYSAVENHIAAIGRQREVR